MSDIGETTEVNTAIDSADKNTRLWSMALHFSQLANCFAPPAGIIATIVIWQVKKDDYPVIDVHGKNAANWFISAAIYSVVFFGLAFLFIGIPLLFILGLCSVVFPIIAGIKANNGVIWKYPLTYEFLK